MKISKRLTLDQLKYTCECPGSDCMQTFDKDEHWLEAYEKAIYTEKVGELVWVQHPLCRTIINPSKHELILDTENYKLWRCKL